MHKPTGQGYVGSPARDPHIDEVCDASFPLYFYDPPSVAPEAFAGLCLGDDGLVYTTLVVDGIWPLI